MGVYMVVDSIRATICLGLEEDSMGNIMEHQGDMVGVSKRDMMGDRQEYQLSTDLKGWIQGRSTVSNKEQNMCVKF